MLSGPQTPHYDGGPEIFVNATKVYLDKYCIHQISKTPYHLQCKGQIKRLNGSLKQALSKLTAKKPQSLAQHLLTAHMVCRIQVNQSTGISPFKVFFGSELN